MEVSVDLIFDAAAIIAVVICVKTFLTLVYKSLQQ